MEVKIIDLGSGTPGYRAYSVLDRKPPKGTKVHTLELPDGAEVVKSKADLPSIEKIVLLDGTALTVEDAIEQFSAEI